MKKVLLVFLYGFIGLIVLGIIASVLVPKLAETGPMANIPKCSDEKTVQLVKQIISENQVFAGLLQVNKADEINLDLIRTIKKDKESEVYTCKAKLDFSESVEDNPILVSALSDITYTVSLTDDKKQFIVELQAE